jgi:predicted nucleic acid-binding protein
MILVDTSVIIDYLRTGDAKIDRLFRTLPVSVCGISRAELLHGVRSPADRKRLITILATFIHLTIPDTTWDAVGDSPCILRSKGVSIPFPDAVIATIAISNNIELWTRDTHFGLVQSAIPALKLFIEPP